MASRLKTVKDVTRLGYQAEKSLIACQNQPSWHQVMQCQTDGGNLQNFNQAYKLTVSCG